MSISSIRISIATLVLLSVSSSGRADMVTLFAFPMVSQSERSWCWAASTEMITQYYGHRVPQCSVALYYRGEVLGLMSTVHCCPTVTDAGCNIGGDLFNPLAKYGYSRTPYPYEAVTATAAINTMFFTRLQSQISPPGVRRPTPSTTGGKPVGCEWRWAGGGYHTMIVTGAGMLDGVRHVMVHNPARGGVVWKLGHGYYLRSYDAALSHSLANEYINIAPLTP